MRVKGGLTAEEQELEKEIAHKTRPMPYNVGLEDGIERGRKEGIERGIERGREEGIERGREEGSSLERYKIVMTVASKLRSAEEIAELTGVPIEEVHQILASRN